MAKTMQDRKKNSIKYSFTTISDYFLDEWSHVVGLGATSLYMHLLKYCYKEKNLAWPTLKTLSQKMGVSERSVIRYQKILLKYGFIQNIFKKKSTSRNNIYQLTLGEDVIHLKLCPLNVTDCPEHDKLSASIVTNYPFKSDNMSACKVTKCHSNNNNLKKNKKTTTRVVAFQTKEEKIKAIRERMGYFDFRKSFIEKMLKTYPLKKIEEKVELYASGREVRNKEGWLVAALKENYGEEEDVTSPTPVTEKRPSPSKDPPKRLSREEELAWIRKIRRVISR